VGYPVKICVVCGEEFELKPGKPGFANRCPSCGEPGAADAEAKSSDGWSTDKQANAARREAMRNLLYRKDS
jgi:hypothetical protein